ncbi:MAG: O-methyltransferase [Bacteroidales bacterium]|nr:O-methyltransferase [Bacteroidales bacterium]MCF8404955.1 O-methyltransferase [Bacteroidales bacterium]
MKDLKLENYLLDYSTQEDELLASLVRETHLKTIYPRMLSGSLQGRFLKCISQMIQPEKILEIGTFTGYSAICLAAGLRPNGILHTLELNPELCNISSKYFQRTQFSSKIKQHIGNALEIIPEIDEEFDLVFLDADKENYLNYYHLFFEKVKKGGFILVDNVLWGKKVLKTQKKADKETDGIIRFNQFIRNDERVEQMILPLRDGIMIIRKP